MRNEDINFVKHWTWNKNSQIAAQILGYINDKWKGNICDSIGLALVQKCIFIFQLPSFKFNI